MTAHVRQAVRSPRELNPSLSPAIEAIILKALAKTPAERFQSAQEFREAVLGLRQSAPMPGAAAPPVMRKADSSWASHERLGEIRAAYQSASTGAGRVVCVRGEPGAGKTALVEAFVAALASAQLPFAVAQGRCSERLSETDTARSSVLEAFEVACAWQGLTWHRKLLARRAVAGLVRRN